MNEEKPITNRDIATILNFKCYLVDYGFIFCSYPSMVCSGIHSFIMDWSDNYIY